MVPLDQGLGRAGLDASEMIQSFVSAGIQTKFPRPSIALRIRCHSLRYIGFYGMRWGVVDRTSSSYALYIITV